MKDVYFSDPEFKGILRNGKRLRRNPVGEDVYLDADGVTILRDEDKIIKAQRIFLHRYYRFGGPGFFKLKNSLPSGPQRDASIRTVSANS
jgi:hypothetical protein